MSTTVTAYEGIFAQPLLLFPSLHSIRSRR